MLAWRVCRSFCLSGYAHHGITAALPFYYLFHPPPSSLSGLHYHAFISSIIITSRRVYAAEVDRFAMPTVSLHAPACRCSSISHFSAHLSSFVADEVFEHCRHHFITPSIYGGFIIAYHAGATRHHAFTSSPLSFGSSSVAVIRALSLISKVRHYYC